MPVFRATNVIPSIAYQRVRAAASNVKANCQAFITQMNASGANYTFLRDVYIFLASADAQFESLKTTPGLAEYAVAQEADPTYDVVAAFNSMQTTIDLVITWMNVNIPLNVTAVAPQAWTQSGPLIATSFNVAQTAGLRAQLQNVVDSIS